MPRLKALAASSTPKMPRQPASAMTPDPASGASIGETEITSITAAMSRVAAAPVYMSRMMARDTTMPAPVHRPWVARKKISWPMLCDSAQPMEARANTARPQSTTGRRPTESEMEPWNRLMKAKANR